MTGTVEFFGKLYALSDGGASEWSLMQLAKVAAAGSNEAEGMESAAALMDILEDVLEPEPVMGQPVVDEDGNIVEAAEVVAGGWPQFKAAARAHRRELTTEKHLMPLIQKAMETRAERPTGRPSASSDGPRSIEPKSVPNSDVKASPFPGRPDLDRQLSIAKAG